jgi:hypothetical protein
MHTQTDTDTVEPLGLHVKPFHTAEDKRAARSAAQLSTVSRARRGVSHGTKLPSVVDSRPACAMLSTAPGLAARKRAGSWPGTSRRTWRAAQRTGSSDQRASLPPGRQRLQRADRPEARATGRNARGCSWLPRASYAGHAQAARSGDTPWPVLQHGRGPCVRRHAWRGSPARRAPRRGAPRCRRRAAPAPAPRAPPRPHRPPGPPCGAPCSRQPRSWRLAGCAGW